MIRWLSFQGSFQHRWILAADDLTDPGRFRSLSAAAIESPPAIEVDNSRLDAEREHAGDSLIVLVPGEIREAASTRGTAQEGDVRVRHVMDEQQHRRKSGDDDTIQNAEQQDADQGYGRDCKLQPAYPPQAPDLAEID